MAQYSEAPEILMTAFLRTVQSVGGKLVPFIIKIPQVATATSLSE